MPSRQAANPVPFTLFPVKAIPALWSCSSSHFPNFPQPPKLLPRITSGLSNSPVVEPMDWARAWRREKKRRGEGNPPSGFKLELEVLGIEVVDADVAILTPTAVAAGRKGKVRNAAGSKEWEVWPHQPLLELTEESQRGEKKKGSVTRPKCGTGCE